MAQTSDLGEATPLNVRIIENDVLRYRGNGWTSNGRAIHRSWRTVIATDDGY